MNHRYTPKQVDFIKEHVKGRSNKELCEMFNAYFGLNLTVNQIKTSKKNRGLSSGLTGRFMKGQKAWNEGMKGVKFCSENGKKTQFKKGHTPHNYRPIGSERINVNGYVEIKVADPNTWKLKHRVFWEKENGPIPKGHAVIFGDGNSQNLDTDNLILVTRKQLAIMNKNGLIRDDAELTRMGIIVADIYGKISERRKQKSNPVN